MEKILNSLLILCIAVLSSCSSSHEEPEQPYTGPWEIYYDEYYYGLHNDSNEFVNWFESHNQFFHAAKFTSGNFIWMFDSTSGKPILDDYKEWYEGNIIWIEIVDNTTEETIKSMISSFESLSIPKDKNGRFDTFKASYRKYGTND